MQFTGETFADTDQLLDGNIYSGCTFKHCKIVYRGGQIPSISDCNFENCSWQFDDAAERTLFFLKMLYHGMGENGAPLVESTFSMIREAPGARPPASR